MASGALPSDPADTLEGDESLLKKNVVIPYSDYKKVDVFVSKLNETFRSLAQYQGNDILNFLKKHNQEAEAMRQSFIASVPHFQSKAIVKFIDHDFQNTVAAFISKMDLLEVNIEAYLHPDPPAVPPNPPNQAVLASMYKQFVVQCYPLFWYLRAFDTNLQYWVEGMRVGPVAFPIRYTLENLKALFDNGKSGGDFQVTYTIPGNPHLYASEGVLGMLLVNMAKNAKLRGDAHRVHISGAQISGSMRLYIDDDGNGIPENVGDILALGVSGSGSTGIGLGDARGRLSPSNAHISFEPHGGLPSRLDPTKKGARFIIDLPIDMPEVR